MRAHDLVVRLVASFAVVVLVAPAFADDRDLLRSRGAPPNVLMVVDSSGSMTRDVASDSISFIASGDDPHAKLYEVKYALGRFFDAYPDFNMGFTFYERDDIEVGHHHFLYRLDPAQSPVSWSWSIRVDADGNRWGYADTQHTSLDSGELLRLGDNNPTTGMNSYVYVPLFGPLGKSMNSDWSRYSDPRIGGVRVDNNSGRVNFNGDAYTGEYRVDAWLEEPMGDAGYYYPAYAWNPAVEAALWDFQNLHDVWAPIVFDPLTDPTTRLAAFNTLVAGRAEVQAVLDANQVGLTDLTLKVRLRRCQGFRAQIDDASGECIGGSWVTVSTITRTLNSAGGLTPADVDPADTTSGFYPETLVPLDYNQWGNNAQAIDYGNDCNGWQGVYQSTTKIPLVPIPTDDDPDMMPYMRSFLRPQPQMQLFFPTRTGGFNYWPRFWDDQPGGSVPGLDGKGIWVTDRVLMGAGRTPIKNSLNDSEQYFYQDVMDRPDELKECRKNFVILLTDGLETCASSSSAPCVAATDLGKKDIAVFVIGYGLGTSGNTLRCIADNSGGELYLPNNVEELVEALRNIGQSIEERSRGFAAPMVPSVEVSTDQKAFLATFLPLNGRSIWQGHLRAYEVDPLTGSIPTTGDGYPDTSKALWDVGEQLTATIADNRSIFYGDESAFGMPGSRWEFSYPISPAERAKLKTYMAIPGMSDAELEDTMAFIRGVRDVAVYGQEKLGDVFHGVPALVGPPACYTCWLNNQKGYRDELSTPEPNDGFLGTHRRRRQVLYVAANDGLLHAIDAGIWDLDEAQFDSGSGDELFAWAPRQVMPTYPSLANIKDHRWTVDGTPSSADVFIDRNFSVDPDPDDREWRSVLLFGQRRGGSSYVCLDITQPDTYDAGGVPDPVAPDSNRSATCANGGGGCSGLWPAFRWEFTDLDDDNLDGRADLGQTWSRPLVAFIKVEVGIGPDTTIEERSVAIFGGGFDPDGLSGRHMYVVDIETAEILLKVPTYGMVPGDVAGLDINLDGFLERAYWGDTEGHIYRLDMGEVAQLDGATGRVTNWPVKLIFYAGVDQPIFMRPALAPVTYTAAGEPILAIGVGTGNRDDIFAPNLLPHHFYMILDRNDYDTVGTLTTVDLQAIPVDAPYADANYLQDPGARGWFLILGELEKVNTRALIANEMVIFSTFRPGEDMIIEPDPGDPDVMLCRRSGDAKTYVINFYNGNPLDPDGSRYIQQDASTAMATDPTIYLGADGRLHVIQALDDLRLVNPVEAQGVNIRAVHWKEE